MIASAHLAIGVAVGFTAQNYLPSNASNPKKLAIAFVGGIISHLMLDAFPHEEYTSKGPSLWLILFTEIVFVSVLTLSPKDTLFINAIIFLGMLGGALPDLVSIARDFLGWVWLNRLTQPIHYFHGRIPTLEASFTFQVLLALLAVIFVKLIKPT